MKDRVTSQKCWSRSREHLLTRCKRPHLVLGQLRTDEAIAMYPKKMSGSDGSAGQKHISMEISHICFAGNSSAVIFDIKQQTDLHIDVCFPVNKVKWLSVPLMAHRQGRWPTSKDHKDQQSAGLALIDGLWFTGWLGSFDFVPQMGSCR